MIQKHGNTDLATIQQAVSTIKTAILQSQLRALTAVNQEQLALYFGIGRYISIHTRSKNWGQGVIEAISKTLQIELPGLRGFGTTNLKNMRLFYEGWQNIETNSSVTTAELPKSDENEQNTIRQLRLTNSPEFPLAEFLSISFTHHIAIVTAAKTTEERLFYIRYCNNYKPTVEELERVMKQDLFLHRGELPNNFQKTMPDYKQAFRSLQMFKDEYMLDFVNTEELGMRDEDVDERVIEQSIVHNVKNFIMAFGKGLAFIGNQVHYDKLGHDHWIDLLFYSRDLRRTIVFELKKGNFKVGYLAQLSSYLRILNDDDRREGENPPVGLILCKHMDKQYVNYIMQDFLQPMGVATYKTADELEPDILKVLPPKEELLKLMDGDSEE